jgi:hypothetical protein
VFHDGFDAVDFPDHHASERLVRIGPMGEKSPSCPAEAE